MHSVLYCERISFNILRSSSNERSYNRSGLVWRPTMGIIVVPILFLSQGGVLVLSRLLGLASYIWIGTIV